MSGDILAGVILSSSVLLITSILLITTGLLSKYSNAYNAFWVKLFNLNEKQLKRSTNPQLRNFSMMVQVGLGIFLLIMWFSMLLKLISR